MTSPASGTRVDCLCARLDRLRESPPIEADRLDLSMRDEERLRDELGPTFKYFARVESEVAAEPLLTMMPRLGTEYGGYRSHGVEFLDIWVTQEQAHGVVFERLQRKLGIQPAEPVVEVTTMNRLGGLVGRLSASLHAVMEMIYLTRGAMHERLTFIGYQRMAERLQTLGEASLLDGVIKPIRAQESGHLSYYRHAAQTLRDNLSNWQIALARRLSLMTYVPVGAGSHDQRADFGHVALALAGESLEAFAEPIQAIAQQLLSTNGRSLPRFVLRSLEACIQESAAAQGRVAA